jgi:sulfur transfer protein SufE
MKENKVEGCVSQVWVRAYLDSDKNVVFEADSDSVLTKGLAALLVNGLSGRPVEEFLRVSPDFAMLLGLQLNVESNPDVGVEDNPVGISDSVMADTDEREK